MLSVRALRVPRHGDASVLTVDEIELPDPRAGQALVQVAASGVNFIDIYQREGIYPVKLPFTLGLEGAGTVVAVGPDTPLAVGDRVAWAMRPGSAATHALVDAAALVPVPDDVPLEDAAAAMLQGMTAHFLTTSTYAVTEGSSVLVHAAAGGVGQWLVQICAARGATVIATAGTQAKRELALQLGADHAIDYTAYDSPEALAAAVREANGGRGVDVAYDGVGKATFDASLSSLRRRGMLVLFGGSSGQVPPVDLQRLNAAGSVFVTRPTLAHYVADREELLWRAGEVFDALVSRRVRLQVGGEFSLDQATAAYGALEGRASTGKLIFRI